jgi:hypothetical protein
MGRDTSMYYLAAVEVGQAVQDAFCDFAEDFFSCSSAELFDLSVDAIQATTFAVFHGYGDRATRVVHECSVVLAYMLRGTVFVER